MKQFKHFSKIGEDYFKEAIYYHAIGLTWIYPCDLEWSMLESAGKSFLALDSALSRLPNSPRHSIRKQEIEEKLDILRFLLDEPPSKIESLREKIRSQISNGDQGYYTLEDSSAA